MASPSRLLDPRAVAALGPAVRPLLRRGRPSSVPTPGRAAVGRSGDPEERRADAFAREACGPWPALSAGERAALEAVRVHTGVEAAGAARALGARAFALGNRIVFGEGEYRPGSADGRALLAHELYHVLGGGTATLRRQPLGTGTGSDLLPAPVTVTWSTDQFEVSFESDRQTGSARLVFAVRYLGKHRTQGPSVRNASLRLSVLIDEAPLNVSVLGSDATSLTLDLYGTGRNLVRLVDRARLDTRPQSKGREHDLETVVDYTVRAWGNLWVLDPAATGEQITQAPGEERPELWPQIYLVGKHGVEVVLDGDGDGDKELELRMQPTEYWPEKDGYRDLLKTLRVDVIQRSTGTLRSLTFSCPQLPDGGFFSPVIKDVTDGLAPTRIDLMELADGCVLEIEPGLHTATESRYRLSIAGQAQDAVFGLDPRPKRKVAQATGAEVAGGIVSLDLTLGAYRDPFRITLRTRIGYNAVFGLAAISDGRPSGGGGAELTYHASPLNARLVNTGLTSIGVDLDGDGRADLMLYDQLTPGRTNPGHTPSDSSRHHRVRVTGPAIAAEPTFDFTYWPGGAGFGAEPRTDADREAARNADAAGIRAAQAKGGGRAEQLDQLELQALALRRSAIGRGALRQATYDALLALWQVLIQARAERGAAGQGQVSAATQSLAAAAGDAFALEYQRELGPYPAQLLDVARLTGAIKSRMWAQVFDVSYPSVVASLDTAIAARLEGKFDKTGSDLATVGKIRGELRALPDTAIRVAASFHPDRKFATKQGYVSAVPLQLYVWRDGDTWRLRDVTDPDKHFDYGPVDAKPGEKTPGVSLFAELDDIDHYPAGVLYWAVPGGAVGQTLVRDHLTWEQALTYLGLATAVVGITLATAGAGTPVAVYGAYALTASALIGATAAGIDLVEHIKRDNLDATTAVLDLAQVAAGVAGAGALVSGRIIVEAGTASAGARFAGAWARAATLAQKAYVPLTTITKVAEVTTVLVMAVDTATRIDQISRDPNIKPEDRTRAVFLLLSQAAILGGLTALSMKGTISPGRGETLVITQGLDGIPVASRVLGKQAVIVDSNLVILSQREARVNAAQARGVTPDPLDVLAPGEQQILNRFRARADVDVRIADKTAREVYQLGIAPQHGFGVAVDRAGAEYEAVVKQLDASGVGGGKGAADRSIVADAFFGVTEPGVTPTFVTGDGGVYKGLYKIEQARPGSGLKPLDKLGKALPVAMPRGFDVTIGTRTLHVIPL